MRYPYSFFLALSIKLMLKILRLFAVFEPLNTHEIRARVLLGCGWLCPFVKVSPPAYHYGVLL
jgi:ABC-type spermidine/putrescine transport system permease subunit I